MTIDVHVAGGKVSGTARVTSFSIEQAIFSRSGDSSPELLASSPGFAPQCDRVIQVLVEFGSRPAGVACPSAVFAQPLSQQHVMVVHVADLMAGNVAAGAPVAFHVLVVPREAYRHFVEEPFALVERLKPDWQARGSLPTLTWPAVPAPRRTVEQVRQVLQRIKGPPLKEDVPIEEQLSEEEFISNSESPALLGGVQALVDGSRLLFERDGPDTELLKALWVLLPNRTRADLWPASFAFSNALGFDVAVVPRAAAEDYPGYTTEDQAANYPEGRYELNLQVAAEAGNQRDLDALFERRSWNDTWRIAVSLLVVVVLAAIASRIVVPLATEGPATDEIAIRQAQARIAAGLVAVNRPLETITLLPPVIEAGKELRSRLPDE